MIVAVVAVEVKRGIVFFCGVVGGLAVAAIGGTTMCGQLLT